MALLPVVLSVSRTWHIFASDLGEGRSLTQCDRVVKSKVRTVFKLKETKHPEFGWPILTWRANDVYRDSHAICSMCRFMNAVRRIDVNV
jgi:hypothetical protein